MLCTEIITLKCEFGENWINRTISLIQDSFRTPHFNYILPNYRTEVIC